MFGDISPTGILIFVTMLFISVGFHEMMHAFVAFKLGDDLAHSRGRVSLNPLKHIDPLLTIILPAVMLFIGMPPIFAAKPVPINTNRISGDELGLAAVGVAGPFTNLALATIAAIGMNAGLFNGSVLIGDLAELFVQLNVALFVFNMMPIPPLDGSRLLYAFAPSSVQRIMEQIEAMGVGIIIFVLVFLLPVLSPFLERANTFILDFLIR